MSVGFTQAARQNDWCQRCLGPRVTDVSFAGLRVISITKKRARFGGGLAIAWNTPQPSRGQVFTLSVYPLPEGHCHDQAFSDPHRRISGDCNGIDGGCGNTAAGLACQGRGIGIGISTVGGVNQDQINVSPLETLRVGFGSAQSIWGVGFLKFVSTARPITNIPYSEQMQIRSSIDGTNFDSWQTFTAPDPSATGGYYSAGFRADNVLALEIAGRTFGSGFATNALSAASLARITVPVPATLPLIGLGLAAFGGLSLRRRSV
jgi:hypothetical protein